MRRFHAVAAERDRLAPLLTKSTYETSVMANTSDKPTVYEIQYTNVVKWDSVPLCSVTVAACFCLTVNCF